MIPVLVTVVGIIDLIAVCTTVRVIQRAMRKAREIIDQEYPHIAAARGYRWKCGLCDRKIHKYRQYWCTRPTDLRPMHMACAEKAYFGGKVSNGA